MKILKKKLSGILTLSVLVTTIFFSGCNSDEKESSSKKEQVALTPPMGWNSYNCYDWRVGEKEFIANVDFMSEHLAQYGWEYAVVDFLWHIEDPDANIDYEKRPDRKRRLDYNPDGSLITSIAIDEYGRLLPDTHRFPGAKDGNGFKYLSDYTHSKGLKFGIHIMRGIPRSAVFNKMPIKGTEFTAADICEPWDTCTWENNMYGIDHTKKGAQEYYDSLIELYASWGVDFIKADDIMYEVFHEKEIEMIRKAIDKTDRPIVLSLSLGPPQISKADFLEENANMWRISGDFWDNWDQLYASFEESNIWSNSTKTGSWPDGDLLTIGRLSINGHPRGEDRISKFTWPEHYTLMTLRCIAKSPLFMGGDLISSPDSTIFFMTNEEVIYVNQHSENGRQIYRGWNDGTIIWIADDMNSDDKFFALFNIDDKEQDITFQFDLEYLRERYSIRDLWNKTELGQFEKSFTANLDPHGAGLYRMKKVNSK